MSNNLLQLVVFEKKTPASAWRFVSMYAAGNQEQLTASEDTIRKTFKALHAADGVRWSVVAIEGDVQIYFSFTRHGRGHRESIPFRSLKGLGLTVLEFPEKSGAVVEETPRCVCGAMLTARGECTICEEQ